MRFNRVLCPLDFSNHSQGVLRHALAMAADPGTNLMAIHAIEPLLLQAATTAGGQKDLRAELHDELQQFVDRETPGLACPPAVETRVVEGSPHAAILEAAAQHDCDLIVMGTHGAGGLAKAWFGSTLERVLRCTRVPVLAVPARGRGLVRDDGRLGIVTVVAGIDFDEPSMIAARAAGAAARRYGASLTLLHVVPEAPRRSRWQDGLDRQHAIRRDRAAHELSWLAAELRAAGTTTFTAVLDGAAADQLASYCGDQQGTLIVLGLRGETSRGSARPGAVAYRVLCAGTQPVLVVPANVTTARAYTVSE